MHIGEIITSDCANGLGIRLSVFVSGCTIHCKGCFQPQTWDFEYGQTYTDLIEDYIIRELNKPQYKGITLLGGEVFEPSNQAGVIGLIRRVRKECPGRDIWIYTGYVYDRDLVPGGRRYTDVTDEILDSIDVLVDGPFVEAQKNLSRRFRGSANQRILDMRRTRAEGAVTLLEFS
ncbi:MAG: anaerobic ribonucleoside-triphosphate reductase activating protein, partial [Lachnospiraceae bacterium]|nr:anaerobic ribonucleoside-triphosphate reductase activating protein [Lachnospiraceae bacterium]